MRAYLNMPDNDTTDGAGHQPAIDPHILALLLSRQADILARAKAIRLALEESLRVLVPGYRSTENVEPSVPSAAQEPSHADCLSTEATPREEAMPDPAGPRET